MKYDFLKYWRIVRKYTQEKHGLTYPDLEMLLFLYSEGKFKRADFDEFNELFPWRVGRFEDLRKRGHIVKWRTQRGREGALYCLSHQTSAIIRSIYQKLDGTEAIGENRNPFFKSNPSYTDKVYRNYIKKLNKELRDGK